MSDVAAAFETAAHKVVLELAQKPPPRSPPT